MLSLIALQVGHRLEAYLSELRALSVHCSNRRYGPVTYLELLYIDRRLDRLHIRLQIRLQSLQVDVGPHWPIFTTNLAGSRVHVVVRST